MDKVRALLDKLDVNELDGNGQSALVHAAAHGQLAVVKHLLDSGARVNLPAAGGETALIAASRRGNAPVMERLITAGADINAADQQGATPLIVATVWATRMASVGIADTVSRVKLLLGAGAHVNATDRKGRGAIMAQVRSGGGTLQEADRLPVLRTLIEAGGEVDATGDRGRTPLMAAAFRGLKETFMTLLDAGANPYMHDNAGRNALMHAAEAAFWTYRKSGYIAIFNKLIELETDLLEKNYSGLTALAIARRNNCKDLMQLLKKAGAYD
jgi:ankyrin repeat protein